MAASSPVTTSGSPVTVAPVAVRIRSDPSISCRSPNTGVARWIAWATRCAGASSRAISNTMEWLPSWDSWTRVSTTSSGRPSPGRSSVRSPSRIVAPRYPRPKSSVPCQTSLRSRRPRTSATGRPPSVPPPTRSSSACRRNVSTTAIGSSWPVVRMPKGYTIRTRPSSTCSQSRPRAALSAVIAVRCPRSSLASMGLKLAAATSARTRASSALASRRSPLNSRLPTFAVSRTAR